VLFIFDLGTMTEDQDERMPGRFSRLRLVPKEPQQIIVDAGIMKIKIVQECHRPPQFKGFPRLGRLKQFFHGKVRFRFVLTGN